jgi:hydrogenase maturation protease
MTNASHQQKIAIVGLGNELMTDDGLGVHAVRRLQKETLPANVRVVEVGTAALHYQDLFEQSDIVIAVDAVAAGEPAGHIVCFDGDQADLGSTCSLHDLGAVGVLRLIDPERRPILFIVGAEPETVDYGTELTPTLQRTVPRLVQILKEMVRTLNTSNSRNIEDLFSIRT